MNKQNTLDVTLTVVTSEPGAFYAFNMSNKLVKTEYEFNNLEFCIDTANSLSQFDMGATQKLISAYCEVDKHHNYEFPLGYGLGTLTGAVIALITLVYAEKYVKKGIKAITSRF